MPSPGVHAKVPLRSDAGGVLGDPQGRGVAAEDGSHFRQRGGRLDQSIHGKRGPGQSNVASRQQSGGATGWAAGI